MPSLSELNPSNKHLHAAHQALLSIADPKNDGSGGYWVRQKTLQNAARIDLAWKNLGNYRPEAKSASAREKQEFTALYEESIRRSVELSEHFHHFAQESFNRAHDNESFFASALRYLQRHMGLVMNDDSALGAEIEHEEQDENAVALADELRTEGYIGEGEVLDDGWGTVQPITNRQQVIDIFNATAKYYADGCDELRKSLGLFNHPPGEVFTTTYKDIEMIASAVDASGCTKGAEGLKAIRNRICAMARSAMDEMRNIGKYRDYYEWMAGAENMVKSKFSDVTGGIYFGRTPDLLVEEELLKLGFNVGEKLANPRYGYSKYFDTAQALAECGEDKGRGRRY